MNGRDYPPEVQSFILANYDKMDRRELTEKVNALDPSREYKQEGIRGWLKLRGLKPLGIRMYKRGGPFWRPLLTPEQDKFLRDNIEGTPWSDMADMMNERFGINVSSDQLRTYGKNHKIRNGVKSVFTKGHGGCEFWTEETREKMRNSEARERTEFKKGHRPANAVPVGTEVTRSYGSSSSLLYIFVKIAEPNTWELKHHLVWEKVHGPIPEDCCIKFLDGNTMNTDIENLVMVSKRQNMVINRRGLRSGDPEITKVGVTLAGLIIATEDRKNEVKKKGRAGRKKSPKV